MPGKNGRLRPAFGKTSPEQERPRESRRNPAPKPVGDDDGMMTQGSFCSANSEAMLRGIS
jgi:hypothetical protein